MVVAGGPDYCSCLDPPPGQLRLWGPLDCRYYMHNKLKVPKL